MSQPMTAEQEGPYKWGRLLEDGDCIVGPDGMAISISPVLDAINEAYAQGRKSRDAELERVRKERDYTPEEALEEANHRWGEGAALGLTRGKLTSDYWLSSGKGTAFFGSSFRAAFAEADKKALEGGGE